MIFGIDEVGRGPLAGPVCVGIVAFDDNVTIEGLKDSKKLTEPKREKLSQEIYQKAAYAKIIFVSEDEIDKLNIKNATIQGMEKLINDIPEGTLITEIRIDGNEKLDISVNYKSIIQGDQTEPSIMAASIIAKVARDDLMKKIDATHPQYGFKNHKGYGTQEHLYALTLYGPCVHHRKSFSPVKKCGIGFLPTQEKIDKTNVAKRFMTDMTDQEIKIELSKIEKTQGKKYAEELREIIRAEWLYVNQASSLRGK